MALASSGCVIAGPPDYKDPGQTPPFLDLAQAVPSLQQVIVATTKTSGTPPTRVDISVPVRSGDANDPLAGLLFVDYGSSNPEYQNWGYASPSTSFNNPERPISVSWQVNSQPGCHTLTLLVTHLSKANTNTGEYFDQNDIALATWWVNVVTDKNNVPPLSDCLTQSP
jgi:hypothetical protein